MSQPSLSGERSINEVVRLALTELGGQAGFALIIDRVKHKASYAEWHGWSEAAMSHIVRAALRHKENGVPQALQLGAEYKMLSLFDAGDYNVAIRKQVQRGGEFFDAARRLAAQCREVHGVTIDVEKMIATAAKPPPQ